MRYFRPKAACAKAHQGEWEVDRSQIGCDQTTKDLLNLFKEFRLYLQGN